MDPRGMKGYEIRISSIMRSFITCTLHQIRMIKSRRIRWTGHVASTNVYKILVWKSGGKSSLEAPMHRWEDNIKIDLRENRVGGHGLDSSGSG
jgi:hypothetical protein